MYESPTKRNSHTPPPHPPIFVLSKQYIVGKTKKQGELPCEKLKFPAVRVKYIPQNQDSIFCCRFACTLASPSRSTGSYGTNSLARVVPGTRKRLIVDGVHAARSSDSVNFSKYSVRVDRMSSARGVPRLCKQTLLCQAEPSRAKHPFRFAAGGVDGTP